MRKYLALIIILTVFAMALEGRAATDEAFAKLNGDLIGCFHFVGTAQIASDPKATKLNTLGALPATAQMRDALLDKLATAPFRLLQNKVANHATNNYAPLIRPILDDLLRTESYAEMSGPTNAVPEFMLAVLLDNRRAALWQSNLSTVITAWTGMPSKEIKGPGFVGWELKKHHDPNVIRCLRAGDWLLFGWGWEDVSLQASFLQRIKDKKRPVEAAKDDWLEVLMDWPAYMARHPMTVPYPLPNPLPKMHLTVQGRKTTQPGAESYVRPKLTMLFSEPLGLKLEPWQIPTNVIVNPMTSFTAVRGFSSWLAQQPEIRNLNASPLPNQATFWAMSSVPFETRIAAPVNNASNYLARIAPALVSLLNSRLSKRAVVSEAIYTNNQIILADMPFFLSPYLRAAKAPTGDYLLAGLFPSPPRTNASPLPPQLMAEISSKPNLVYYNWELNKERIDQARAMQQVYIITSGQPLPLPDLPLQKWIQVVKTNLADCATEITLSAPNELTLVRNGPLGFTGFEINLLQYWIDSVNFPFPPQYQFPPRSNRKKSLPH